MRCPPGLYRCLGLGPSRVLARGQDRVFPSGWAWEAPVPHSSGRPREMGSLRESPRPPCCATELQSRSGSVACPGREHLALTHPSSLSSQVSHDLWGSGNEPREGDPRKLQSCKVALGRNEGVAQGGCGSLEPRAGVCEGQTRTPDISKEDSGQIEQRRGLRTGAGAPALPSPPGKE